MSDRSTVKSGAISQLILRFLLLGLSNPSELKAEVMSESYEKWYPLERVPSNLESVSLITARSGDLLIVCHSSKEFEGDILLNCGYMRAYQVHEEFVHPSMEDYPQLLLSLPRSADGHQFTFPFLKVNDSIWLSTFSEARQIALPDDPLHLEIITSGQTVDFLCADYPKARLISREAVEQVFGAIEVFEIS